MDRFATRTTQEKRIRWPQRDPVERDRRELHMPTRPQSNAWGQQQLLVSGRRIQAVGPAAMEDVVYLQGNRLKVLWVGQDVAWESTIFGVIRSSCWSPRRPKRQRTSFAWWTAKKQDSGG